MSRVAAYCHGDTPGKTGKTPHQEPWSLNNKLRACLETSWYRWVTVAMLASVSSQSLRWQSTPSHR